MPIGSFQSGLSDSPGFTIFNLDPFGAVAPFGPAGFQTTYDLSAPGAAPDRIKIVQTIRVNGTTLGDSNVEIHTVIKNMGNSPLAIGVRHLWDFQIGADDGPVFTQKAPDGQELIREADFAPPAFGFYRIEDNDFADPTSPLYSIFGTVSGPGALFPQPTTPGVLKHVAWPLAINTAFDYTVDPNLIVSTLDAPHRGAFGGDSAVLYYFGPTPEAAITIPGGGDVPFSAFLFASTTTPPPGPQNPVLIVPGIIGSLVGGRFMTCGSTSGWSLEQLQKTYNDLYHSLELANYTPVGAASTEWLPQQQKWETENPGANLFPAPYDWRQPNSVSATQFLMNQIDRAKFLSGKTKVDVIAHSMGGLVVRSYIQSPNYRDDIDKFIMIGTPNHGLADPYFMWEGGETVPGDSPFFGAYIQDLVGTLRAKCSPQSRNLVPFIHEHIPALQELLPVEPSEPYLINCGDDIFCQGGVGKPYDTLTSIGRNPLLGPLNNSVAQLSAVNLRLLGGKNRSTVKAIKVRDRNSFEASARIWDDGSPIALFENLVSVPDGDGRVLLRSLQLPNRAVDQETPEQGVEANKHDCLPTKYADEAIEFLLGHSVPGSEPSGCPEPGPAALDFMFFSPVLSPDPAQFLVIDPAGRRVGFDVAGQIDLADIPGSFYSGRDEIETIAIPNPLSGNYQVVITGNASGSYQIRGTYIDNQVVGSLESGGTVTAGSTATFTVSLDQSSSPVLQGTFPPASDIALGLVASGDPVLVGNNLAYSIVVGNAGPSSASGVVVTDSLPGTLTFVSATPSQGSCGGTTTVTCDLGTLALQAMVNISVIVKPTAAGPLTNTVHVVTSTLDLVPVNDSASVTITVNNPIASPNTVSPTSATAGGAAITLTMNGSGFVNGSIVRWNGSDRPTTFVSSTQLTAAIPTTDLATGGNVQITVFNPSPGGGTSGSVSFAVTEFTVGASAPQPVTSGQSATATVTLTPQFGTFGNTITLACSTPLPPNASCTFAPPTLTPGASPAISTLTINTRSGTAAFRQDGSKQFPAGRSVLAAVWLGLFGLSTFGIFLTGRAPKKRPVLGSIAILLLILVAGGLVGCSAPQSSSPPPGNTTPPGTYTITVTATAGSLQHSTTFALTVR